MLTKKKSSEICIDLCVKHDAIYKLVKIIILVSKINKIYSFTIKFLKCNFFLWRWIIEICGYFAYVFAIIQKSILCFPYLNTVQIILVYS